MLARPRCSEVSTASSPGHHRAPRYPPPGRATEPGPHSSLLTLPACTGLVVRWGEVTTHSSLHSSERDITIQRAPPRQRDTSGPGLALEIFLIRTEISLSTALSSQSVQTMNDWGFHDLTKLKRNSNRRRAVWLDFTWGATSRYHFYFYYNNDQHAPRQSTHLPSVKKRPGKVSQGALFPAQTTERELASFGIKNSTEVKF